MPFCYKCGTKLADEAMFCFNCGTKTVSAADNNDMPGNVQSNEKADTTSFPDMSKEEWQRVKSEFMTFLFCQFVQDCPGAMQELAGHVWEELRQEDRK